MGEGGKQPLFVLNSLILQLLCQNCHRIMLYSSLLILEGCFERPNQKEIGVLSLVVLSRWARFWSWTVDNPGCSGLAETAIPNAGHYFYGKVWQDAVQFPSLPFWKRELLLVNKQRFGGWNERVRCSAARFPRWNLQIFPNRRMV